MILEDYDGISSWEDYAKSNGYTSQQLDVIYHSTHRSNLKSIMRYGLNPKNSGHVEDEQANDIDQLGPPYNFVYFSHLPSMSMAFGPGADGNEGDTADAVLLSVRLPQGLKQRLVLDRGEFIRAPFVIPPRYITVEH
jgi:hypothetical protein